MAEETDPESRTEDPTPRRREEAKRQGRVPFSAEMVGGVMLLAGILGLMTMGRSMGEGLLAIFRDDLPRLRSSDLGTAETQALFLQMLARVLTLLGPFFALLLGIAIASSVAQVGFDISTEKLEPDFEKLNPMSGLKRLFSPASLVKGLLTILKVVGLAVVAYIVLEPRLGVVAAISRERLAAATISGWEITTRLALWMSAVIALVAVLDYLYQRYKFEQSLRMTKQEVKDELKHEEGDPQIKHRMRQLARERMRQKMLTQVPKATVVITNPTHIAIALRYEQTRDTAPVVVARGAGMFAKRIVELARNHSVPIVERPPLARAIYKSVRENQPIPGPLFRAVAEVIAFVYRLRGPVGVDAGLKQMG